MNKNNKEEIFELNPDKSIGILFSIQERIFLADNFNIIYINNEKIIQLKSIVMANQLS